jgi:hypothetical protein
MSTAKRVVVVCSRQYSGRKEGVLLREVGVRGDRWKRVTVPATECPRIPADFLEEERVDMGAAWFSQEYMCEFVDDGSELARPERPARPDLHRRQAHRYSARA